MFTLSNTGRSLELTQGESTIRRFALSWRPLLWTSFSSSRLRLSRPVHAAVMPQFLIVEFELVTGIDNFSGGRRRGGEEKKGERRREKEQGEKRGEKGRKERRRALFVKYFTTYSGLRSAVGWAMPMSSPS